MKEMKIKETELQAFLRNDFVAFVERSFYELNPNTEYLPNWHLEAIAEALEKCRAGVIRRLIITVPPRSLKSHMTSIAYVAWLLGHEPTAQVICASYAQELADKLAADCRFIMNAGWYRSLFPWTRLAGARQAVHDFSTNQKGSRLATSVGGVLTGRGADYIIIDDPLKPEEALSETQRASVNAWFNHTLISRLNDKRSGRIVLIMQRLHEDDLVGHLLQQGGWHLLKFPAIAEDDELHFFDTPYGKKAFSRKRGAALHPDREPLEVLASIREVQGEYNFSGQYQQSPAPLGGGMIREAWFKFYSDADTPGKFGLIFQSWDTANKPTELSDFSVCTTWGVRDNHLYLLHVFRKRVGYPALKRAVLEQAKAFSAKTVVIEDKASGTQLIQDLIGEGLHSIQKYEPTMEKIMRLHSVTSTIENGFCHLPEKAEWLAEYLHELATFPKGKFDDQVDSTSQGLDWFKNSSSNDVLGLIGFYKREAGVVETKNRQDLSAPKKCPECGSQLLQSIPGGLRCGQCGWQWLNPKCRPDIPFFNRSGIR
jgi:predicted phage terminase large subunit-like protein